MKSDPVSSSFSALLYDQLREPSNQEPQLARDAALAIPPGSFDPFGPGFGPGPAIPPGGFGSSSFGPVPALPTGGFGPGPVVPPSTILVSPTASA